MLPVDLDVLTFNLNNPSRERAERQYAYLAERPESVLVLTETARSKGCEYLAEQFRAAGAFVVFPEPPAGTRERGVMIVSRALAVECPPIAEYLPHRVAGVAVSTSEGLIAVTGVYVPSRDASPEKVLRKQTFLSELALALPSGQGGRGVLIGDFNILEPAHVPRYGTFRPWEYEFYSGLAEAGYVDAFRLRHPTAAEHSWVGRTGDGYRYDHAHVTLPLASLVTGCSYVHDVREGLTRLTDHSALTLRLDTCPTPLGGTAPTTEAGQHVPVLF